MTRIIAIVATCMVLVLLGATWWLGRPGDDMFAECRESTVATGASSIGGPFTLVREDGVTVTDTEVITKPTLLYFGYTFCPDVCPMDNARNAEALELLEARGVEAQVAFISIDPERDTPEVVADFTDYFHDDMIGLTGSLEQVKAASLAYKTYFRKQDDAEDPEYYLVDHSTFTYLVLPEIGFVEFYKRDDTAEKIADGLACFAKAAS